MVIVTLDALLLQLFDLRSLIGHEPNAVRGVGASQRPDGVAIDSRVLRGAGRLRTGIALLANLLCDQSRGVSRAGLGLC